MAIGDWVNKAKMYFEAGSFQEGEWDEGDDPGYSPQGRAFYDEVDEEDPVDLTGTASKYESRKHEAKKKKNNNVVDFDNSRDPKEKVVVKILAPKDISDAPRVSDYLSENKICIINMQGAEHTMAQRVADYLGGVCYALNGQVERIDSHTFVMAPSNATISADLKEELKSSGIFSRSSK